ncbi:sigma-70 family RNA polymerase sigma factor [Saccharibacillus kuerlensis]|uniref:DNA-directed RNA polymerase sigma-70 factor n=1 Tax=Saccharibacillus kuerlensis TaxID=459527 RepID=A0ABQ2L1U4_9BACL|nr:sigma-70 family RNA polymerase sigma factor [Saccharibacillus kuerlensis]GGN99876.1 DNA-directed RNA polymerase sigma-70 factor [Saccharibacillus kuerlensis]
MAETLGLEKVEKAEDEVYRSAEEFFFERIDRQSGKLYSIAYSYLRSEADALEMLQEASFRAWSKKKSLKDEALFDSWLIRILINCCMDELRRRKKVVPLERVGEERRQPEMQSSSAIDLEHAMQKMPEKYRHVLILRFYHDMTLNEIARILNKPESTIKTRLYRALKQIRTKLENDH